MTNPVPFRLHVERLFRETPSVHFADIGIPGSNGLDLVRHTGPAISPPNKEDGTKQYYIHNYQTDYNRVLSGSRLFELICPAWNERAHWFIYLEPDTGALEIPEKCYHRSYSCESGSILINQAIRRKEYSEDTEFVPTVPWSRFSLDLYPLHFFNITQEGVDHFIEFGRLP